MPKAKVDKVFDHDLWQKKYVDGMSCTQIANELDMNQPTVYRAVKRYEDFLNGMYTYKNTYKKSTKRIKTTDSNKAKILMEDLIEQTKNYKANVWKELIRKLIKIYNLMGGDK